MKNYFPYLVVFFYILLGLYFGIGGFVDDSLTETYNKNWQYEQKLQQLNLKIIDLKNQIETIDVESSDSNTIKYRDSLIALERGLKTSVITVVVDSFPKSYISVDHYSTSQEIDKTMDFFKFIDMFPSLLLLVITACSFGLLGGTIKIIRDTVFNSIPISETKYVLVPLLGLLSGLIIFALSYIIPIVLVSGENEVRKTTLMFLSLFAGIMVDKFYFWLETLFNKLFKSN